MQGEYREISIQQVAHAHKLIEQEKAQSKVF
jgi:hypothetical protein